MLFENKSFERDVHSTAEVSVPCELITNSRQEPSNRQIQQFLCHGGLWSLCANHRNRYCILMKFLRKPNAFQKYARNTRMHPVYLGDFLCKIPCQQLPVGRRTSHAAAPQCERVKHISISGAREEPSCDTATTMMPSYALGPRPCDGFIAC